MEEINELHELGKLLILVIVLLIIWIVLRKLGKKKKKRAFGSPSMRHLQKRFMRGEISKEEFEKQKEKLSQES
ncbi:MAG: hypothetical protein R6U04_07380 [Bacteroidales bacterium]